MKAKREAIPAEKWEWFGMAGHLCVADRCLHHLCTKVGDYMISTVGNYWPDGIRGKKHPIGSGRDFETFVFRLGKKFARCECGCGVPKPSDMSEIDSLPANDCRTADKNHMKMCRRYALSSAEPASETDRRAATDFGW